MIHLLKIYVIKGIANDNIEIDYNEIPKDLHDYTKEFIKFFKLDINNTFINNKNEALIIAAGKGYLEILKYLHQNGIDIHADDDYIFRSAVYYDYIEIVKYLHQNGANIAIDNNIALRWAASYGYLEIFKYLLKNGAALMLGDDYSVFECATRNGQLKIVKYLVENIAGISFYVREALYFAKKNNHKEVVEYLQSKFDLT
jgi:ankyrin repeat protein